MSNEELARYALHDRLRDVLGPQEATTLMAALPPPGGEPATRSDLRAGMAELRGEMAELGAELRGEMAELRVAMAEQGGALRAEMTVQTRTLVFAMVATNATLVALAFAAARLA